MMLIVSLLAMAQTPGLDCTTPPTTQSGITECAVIDFRAADRELNRLWPQVLAGMRGLDREHARLGSTDKRPGYAAALLASQRAWLAYRDAHCIIDGYAMRGGTGEPMLVAGCKARLTEERVKVLKDLQDRF